MKLLINYNFGESYMKGHVIVVILMVSLHYFFLELMIVKDFHSYKTYDIVRNLIDFQH